MCARGCRWGSHGLGGFLAEPEIEMEGGDSYIDRRTLGMGGSLLVG